MDAKAKLKASGSGAGKAIKKFTGKPHGWKTNPIQAFYRGKGAADASNQKATPKYDAAKQKAADAFLE